MQSFVQYRQLRRQLLHTHERTSRLTAKDEKKGHAGRLDVAVTEQQKLPPSLQDSESTSPAETPSSSPERFKEDETSGSRPGLGKEDEADAFLVDLDEDDPMDPHNWGRSKKVLATCLVTAIGFIVSWASAIDSAALEQAKLEFGVSDVTESLATGLYLIAFGIGSLLAGPLSETVGRNPVYVGTMSLYMIFIMASGLAPNIGAQLAFRFLAGFFANSPLTCAGGSLSDMWTPSERSLIIPLYSIGIFNGALLAPVAGGWIGQSTLVSWRWVEWITLILSGAILAAIILFQPETYRPILLTWKAKHLRSITGDERYKAPMEVDQAPFLARLWIALTRPFAFLVKEPIVMAVALYLVLVYVCLFTFLDGFTFIFTDTYGFSEGMTGTVFVAIVVGLSASALFLPLISYWTKREIKKREARGDKFTNPPELRLAFAMLGAPAFPISLFWMGWTNDANISPWSGICASALFGWSVLCIYISFYQYVIDTYEKYAASGLASVTLLRYVVSGAMVPVAIPMYRNLGVHWSLTVLALISVLLTPLPFIFYRYGAWIRSKSRTARSTE